MELNATDQASETVAAYPRHAVEDFLADAAAEQGRLERTIADAQLREQRARAAVEEAELTAQLVRSTLQDLRHELDTRRREVQATVDEIVGKARAEAATILAEARAEAAMSAIRPHGRGIPPGDDGADPDPPGSPFAPPSGPAEAVPPPSASPPHPTLRNGDSAGPAASNGGPVVPSPLPLLTPWPAPAEATPGPDPSGAAATPPPSAAADVATNATEAKVDELLAPRPKSSHFPSLLRRGRTRGAEPEPEPSPDEFLDFLRGALIDDTPLEESSDADLRWRWTP